MFQTNNCNFSSFFYNYMFQDNGIYHCLVNDRGHADIPILLTVQDVPDPPPSRPMVSRYSGILWISVDTFFSLSLYVKDKVNTAFEIILYILVWFTWDQLFIASYYRHLSVDIKIKNYKIKSSFVRPEGPKAKRWLQYE